jgi:hypothetical protein
MNIQPLSDWLADREVRANREQAESLNPDGICWCGESAFCVCDPPKEDRITSIGQRVVEALCLVGGAAVIAALFAGGL